MLRSDSCATHSLVLKSDESAAVQRLRKLKEMGY